MEPFKKIKVEMENEVKPLGVDDLQSCLLGWTDRSIDVTNNLQPATDGGYSDDGVFDYCGGWWAMDCSLQCVNILFLHHHRFHRPRIQWTYDIKKSDIVTL